MLGDFQYYVSSSEGSDSDSDSDVSVKSDDSLERLTCQKKSVEESILLYEKKLRTIQKTLKSLNENRKMLLAKRNELISSSCLHQDTTNSTGDATTNQATASSSSHTYNSNVATMVPNDEPLNLNIPDFRTLNDVGDAEEYDTDDEDPKSGRSVVIIV